MHKRLGLDVLNIIEYLLRLNENDLHWEQCFYDGFLDIVYIIESVKDEKLLSEVYALQKSIQEDKKKLDELKKEIVEIREKIITTESFIRVDFIISRRTSWGAIKPLVIAFERLKCVTQIVPIPMIREIQDNYGRELKRIIEEEGFECCDYRDYEIEKELPDIIIDNMAVDCSKVPEFRFLRLSNLVESTVAIEHSVLTGYTEAMKSAYFRVGRSRAWLYSVTSELFSKSFPLIFRIDGEYITEGCTESDTLFEIKNTIKESTKKSVLWNIDCMDPNIKKESDYLRLKRELFYLEKMLQNFPDIDAIVRPHPAFYNQIELKELSEELNRIVKNYDNAYFDENVSIYDSYKEADAMVTWMTSTTCFTFGCLEKPFVVIPTFIEGGYDTLLDMYLLNALEVVYNFDDMQRFMENVVKGIDEKKEKRKATIELYMGMCDGKACERIAIDVLKKFEGKYGIS